MDIAPKSWGVFRCRWYPLWLVRSEGSELAEFAISLPLLVVLVVGIYDFGGAFTLKNKLNSAVLEGARVASSQHTVATNNGGCGAPASICVTRDIVASSLTASVGSDCGLGSAAAAPVGTLAWNFLGTCTGFSLEIERAAINPDTATFTSPFSTEDYFIENSRITLTYPYQWRFNRAVQLLAPGANYLSSTIKVAATMQNID